MLEDPPFAHRIGDAVRHGEQQIARMQIDGALAKLHAQAQAEHGAGVLQRADAALAGRISGTGLWPALTECDWPRLGSIQA